MGQIIGGAAKPKRCNLNQLSQVPTPAAGEYILVSSDNSMNAAGQGNFDCYIEGDGTKAATALELKPIAEGKIAQNENDAISGKEVFLGFYDFAPKTITEYTSSAGYIYRDGSVVTVDVGTYQLTDAIPVKNGDILTYTSACYGDTAALAFATSSDATTWQVLQLGVGNNAASTRSYNFTSDGYIRLSYNQNLGLSLELQTNEPRLKYGCDDKVTEDGERAVKGSGVYYFVTTGKDNVVITSADEKIGYIDNKGIIVTVNSGDYRYTEPIPITAGASLIATFACYPDTAAISFSTKKNPSVWQVINLGIDGSKPSYYSHTFSDDGYIVLSYNVAKQHNFRIAQLAKVVPWVTDSDISNHINTKNFDCVETTYTGGLILMSGTSVTTSDEYYITDPIFVKAGTKIAALLACHLDTAAIATASSSDSTTWNPVMAGLNNNSLNVYEYTPDVDIYVRFCYRPAYGIQVFKQNGEKDKFAPADVVGVKEIIDAGSIPFTAGYYMNTSGELVQNSVANVTEPISVKRGDELSCYAIPINTTEASLLAFSADGVTWKSLINGGESRRVFVKAIAPEDGYFRISYSGLISNFNLKNYEYMKLGYLANNQLCKRFSNCKSFGTQPAANGSEGSFMNVAGNYDALITTIYEPLRAANPNYITRTNIGRDSSNTYDMYLYEFTPKYYTQSVILIAGVHANEPDAVACLARIMQLITNSYSDDEDLTYLRYNVKFIVVPVVNVWGYSQSPKKRYSYSGKEMQSWETYPLIQELANLKPYLLDFSKTSSFLLDMHTTTNNSYRDFYGITNKFDKNLRTIFRTNAWLCDNYAKDGRSVDDQYLGYLDGYGGILSTYFHRVTGIPSATLELSDKYWDSSLSTSTVITMGVTMWLNYIIQMVNDCYNFTPYGIPIADYRESRP